MWISMIKNDKPVFTTAPNSLSNAAECLSYKICTFHILKINILIFLYILHLLNNFWWNK
jgi:hypothetical protein